MHTNLTFLQTWSIPEFKEAHQIDKLSILQNSSTGKAFFSYGVETGACSKKVASGQVDAPVISQVCSGDTGEVFMLLHQKGESEIIVLGTL